MCEKMLSERMEEQRIGNLMPTLWQYATCHGWAAAKVTDMDFDSYQKEALRTDRVPGEDVAENEASLIASMLGLAGETGQLLCEYKKHLRDGQAHSFFKQHVSEELGDLLWYISNVASKFDLSLSEIAAANLTKIGKRWDNERVFLHSFDTGLPESERLPRRFDVDFIEYGDQDSRRVRVLIDGEQFGSELTDNAHDPDGYRFHDIFHFSYAATLGWSPITRALLQRKRKSQPEIDEVEDGGRAAVIEESISLLAFDYARRHSFLEGITTLDNQLLRTIKDMTSHLEVSQCTIADWERAILNGMLVWRSVRENQGGRITVNLDERNIIFLGPLESHELPE